jgi:hypothetical protein
LAEGDVKKWLGGVSLSGDGGWIGGMTSPFRYIRSKAKRQTSTVISPITTFLRSRPANIWNGFTSPVLRSIATTSPSSMNELTPSPRICGTRATKSGYLSVINSRCRLNIETFPASSQCICARCPSYLYSQLNSLPSSFTSISSKSRVIAPSIGFSGICNAIPHSSSRAPTPLLNNTGTISL